MAKTYTAAGSATAGDVYTAAAHNVIVTDVNNFIVPAFCVTTGFNASQNFAHATSTAVQFSGADAYDTDAMHDPSVNNTRFTVTTEGLYICSFHGQINSTGVTQLLLSLTLSGTGFAESGTGSPITASAARNSVTGIVYATSGQYVEALVYQESAASASRQLSVGRFSMAWLGRAS